VPKLSLNGEVTPLPENNILSFLLEQQGYQMQKIAVAINGAFVPRSQYAATAINDGDEIDVIQAVGGGGSVRCVERQVISNNIIFQINNL
jgi:sulfur carrier protein